MHTSPNLVLNPLSDDNIRSVKFEVMLLALVRDVGYYLNDIAAPFLQIHAAM